MAQIDPASFQASLALAQATTAGLKRKENAKLDLKRYQKSRAVANTTAADRHTGGARRQLEETLQADQANIESAKVSSDYTDNQAPLAEHRCPAAR